MFPRVSINNIYGLFNKEINSAFASPGCFVTLKAFVQSAPDLRPISSRLAHATTSPSEVAKHRGCFPFYLALILSLSGQSITTGGFLDCCNASHPPSPQPCVDLRQRLRFDVTAHLVCRSSSPPDGLPTGTRQQEESHSTLIVGQKLVGNPGRGNLLVPSPCLLVPGLQLSGIPYLSPHPSHTPEPALSGGICIFYPTSRAGVGPQILHLNPELLRVGFLKGSQEEWLHWNL